MQINRIVQQVLNGCYDPEWPGPSHEMWPSALFCRLFPIVEDASSVAIYQLQTNHTSQARAPNPDIGRWSACWGALSLVAPS